MNLRRWTYRRCLSDGTLRSAVDNGVDRMPEIENHLRQCLRCRARMAEIAGNATFVSGRLELMAVDAEPVDVIQARQRARTQIAQSREQNSEVQGDSFVKSMWKYRAARSAVAMMALVLLTTAFVATPMRSLADDLFDRFRVEKFEAVTVQMDEFTEFQTGLLLRAFTADHERLMTAAENLAEFESTYDHNNPESELAKFDSLDEAQAAYGDFKIASDLPAGFVADPRFMISQPGSAWMTVDTASANAIIEELRLPIDSIPDASEMPEMVFEMNMPAALVTYYTSGLDGHLAMLQMESPTLITPEGLNMDALREDILDLPGLPEDFVSQLQEIDDWRNTLVVPVPEGAQARDVTVSGQGGLLIESGSFDGSDWGVAFKMDGDVSVVMWNEDGILHVVAGTVSGAEILNVANSLR
jgi:hypothetical protein